MIEVLIVDDHRIVAEGVSQLMTGEEGIRTVGIAATLSEASQMMSELHPQVVLLDVALPDGDGIDALPEIIRLMSEGCTMKEIADRLCLSFETVHSYTKNLRVKLGCNNTASMVRTAMEQHWI